MIGRTGRPRPSRLGAIALAVLLLALSGCAGTTLVVSAPPVVVTPPPPSSTPSPIATPSSAPTATPSAIPTAVSSAAALPSLRPPAGATVTMRDASYAITGDTAAELVAAMRAQKLVDRSGDVGFALTTWDVNWTYKWVAAGGTCGIGNLAVKVEVVTTLPSWNPPATADTRLVDNWERFTNALVVHERGHAQNGLDRAAEIAAAMASMDPKPSCNALERSADAAGEAIIEAGRRWDVTYDAETKHGLTQGASFP
jgi:predicted secreted Zn-dependent protease